MPSITPVANDGYTFSCSVPARGPWSGFKFHYRPLLGPAVCEFMDTPKRGQVRFKAICKLLAEQVVAWDVKKPGSEDLIPASEENLSKLPVSFLEDMANAVLGYSALEQEADLKNS